MSNNRWLVAGLIISLVLNIGIIGFLVGRFSGAELRGQPMFDPTMSITHALRGLPEERRSELRPLVREQMRSMRPSARRLRQAQEELYGAILAEPFQRTALEQSLAAFRENLVASQERNHEAFADVIDALSADERRRLLDHLKSRASRHRGDGRRPPPR